MTYYSEMLFALEVRNISQQRYAAAYDRTPPEDQAEFAYSFDWQKLISQIVWEIAETAEQVRAVGAEPERRR
jgi:hypothetical protein